MTELAPSLDRAAAERELEGHRRELTGYCYRMLGSAFDAEDAAQEAMVRAWRALDRFDGRSSLRTWLYRITTNVCLDALNGRNRRALPMDMGPARTASEPLGAALPEATWVEPMPDGRVVRPDTDPSAQAEERESIRLAFVTALQHLPPRQRAVLILRDVLRWSAKETAELLDTTVASVNSALQRAHATLEAKAPAHPSEPMDDEHEELLARYVEVFERYDIASLVTLLHDDATHTMPPWDLWLEGPVEIERWMLGQGAGCEGSRLVPVRANGQLAFGQYKPDPGGGPHVPFSIQLVEVAGGRIAGITYFLDTKLFPLFGLPPMLAA